MRALWRARRRWAWRVGVGVAGRPADPSEPLGVAGPIGTAQRSHADAISANARESHVKY